MTNPFDKLIEETREKYRVSWENSLEKYKRSCLLQDWDFEWAIKHGYFPPRNAIEKIINAKEKTRLMKADYGLEIKDVLVDYD